MTAAVGQQPPGKDEKPKPQQKAPPNELDAAIAASANHPDVRLAQAKLQMAQAELDQAKLQVVQRLAAAHAKVQAAKAQVEIESKIYNQLTNRPAAATWESLIQERALAQAKAALAAAEAEWQAARGQPAGHAAAPKDEAWEMLQMFLSQSLMMNHDAKFVPLPQFNLTPAFFDSMPGWRVAAPAPGSAADKLRGLIDKRVKLGDLKQVTLARAIEALRSAAGTDLVIRVPESEGQLISVAGGELPLIAWVDLFLDEYNATHPTRDQIGVYVREYGLLFEQSKLAPRGAPTLAEFARQVQSQKDATQKAGPK